MPIIVNLIIIRLQGSKNKESRHGNTKVIRHTHTKCLMIWYSFPRPNITKESNKKY